MSEKIPVPASFHNARIQPEQYAAMYEESVRDPETFWAKQADTVKVIALMP